MRKIFTLILSVMFVSGAFAQDNPTAVIKQTTVKPVIDGVIDAVWATTDSNAIARPFFNSVTEATKPTLGEPGETWWKALWDADGYYLVVNVVDDNYFPNYVNGSGNPWDYDKIEVYFDVNYVLRDEGGPDAGGATGHYQFAPDMSAAKEDGLLTTETDGRKHAFKVEKPNYVAEYFVPWGWLKDKEGIGVDKSGQIGFDVMINDNDPGVMARMRAIWGADNTQGTGEAWVNMDESGIITLEGAEPGVEVSSVTLSGGTITTDNGTLPIEAAVLPVDATVKTLTWSVVTAEGSTGRATISSTGVLTAILDGVVTVTAKAQDASFLEASVNVTIFGQIPTLGELSYIVDGFFDNGIDGKVSSVWDTWANAVVTDGVLMFGPDEVLADPWSYHLQQTTHIPFALKDLDFIISFKAWADAPRNMPLILEDGYNDGNQWDSYFTSTSELWDNGKIFNIPLTTVPKVFKLPVNFSPMKETTIQAFNWQVGKDTPKMYLDSVYIISVADMALIPTAIAQNRTQSFKVYPNPAVNKLHINLTSPNAVVAIYSSVGIKMDEVNVVGTQHTFDVSRYTKGLYFVKANNSVVKFVK